MAIWWFIGFIVLISIIFGVSLHDAFWGIVVFVINMIIVGLAFFLLEHYTNKAKKKIAYMKTKKGKAELKTKAYKLWQEFLDGLLVFFLASSFFAPLLLEVVFNVAFPEFTSEHQLLVLLVSVSPFVLSLYILYRIVKNATTKK